MIPNSPFLQTYVSNGPITTNMNVKVAFIVGDQNDIGKYSDDIVPPEGDPAVGPEIENAMQVFSGVYLAGHIHNLNLYFGTLILPPVAAMYMARAVACFDAHRWTLNYVESMGELYGHISNDCLVTTRAQYLSVHPDKLIDDEDHPYLLVHNIDHSESNLDDRIWGTGYGTVSCAQLGQSIGIGSNGHIRDLIIDLYD